MKIDASQLELTSSHNLSARRERVAEHVSGFAGALRDADAALGPGPAITTPAAVGTPPAAEADEVEPRIRLLLSQLIDAILSLLSGDKKCRCRVDELADLKQALPGREDGRDATTPPATRAVFTWERRTIEHIAESEHTEVAARGRVRTVDGREIDFSLGLAMCREFSRTQATIERGRIEFKDPLVLNFDGRAAELADTCFSFDLDADGQAESLPMLARGSGFLALDVDGDGRIADGRELFGATGEHAGDGFADLARHDADANGWIDERDPVFAALGVWFPEGRVVPLGEAGVGAIGLASAWSPFALKDADNRQRGQIWQTGIYLAEDGRVGSVQQLDLADETRPAGVD